MAKATAKPQIDLSALNSEQRAAVMHDQGPLLVVAGAGTGKTRVITERIAWLIAEGKAKPEEILALTFTDKAAGEMLDRLDILIGWQAYRVNVMTFHAFGRQLLQRWGNHLGRPASAELIPETAKLVLLRRHLSEANLSYYGTQDDLLDFLSSQLSYIQALQNADIEPDSYAKYVQGLTKSDAHTLDVAEATDRLKIYRLYEKIKRDYHLIDYHDQLKLPLELLRQRPNLTAQLRAQYRYILVDEYQDTNTTQDALLRTFVPPGGNIFAVGDDDQAIYGFRGAALSNILDFTAHFGVEKPAVLTRNYRSSQAILDAAYKLIQGNNPDRLENRLQLDKRLIGGKSGDKPEFIPYPTPVAEREGIAKELAARLQDGQAASDMAVLATSHAALRALAKVLRSHQIPYALSSSVDIFEQPELLQLWHLLRWLGLSAEDEAIVQLLGGPFVGWEHTRIRQLLEMAKRDHLSVEEALQQTTAQDKTVQTLVQNLQHWRVWAGELPVSQLVYRLVFETGLSEEWVAAADGQPRMIRLFEDLQLWLQQLQAYEQASADPQLGGYLSVFARPPQITTQELSGDESGVALLTVHAAKGLEFETVFIINNTFEAWHGAGMGGVELPPELLADKVAELPPEHERRRLLYVALTRAKTELTLSAPLLNAGGRARRPSPFLQALFSDTELALPNQTNITQNLDKTLDKLQRFAPKTMEWREQRLPFETESGWLELSVGDIDNFTFCGFEFYMEKVLKLRTPLGPQVSFGTLLHALFRDYYQSRLRGEPLDLKQLQQRLDDVWSDRGYQTKAAAETDQMLARQTLKAFYKREEARRPHVRSSEEEIVLKLPEYKLRLKGRIDATFEVDGGIEVRDFKTGRTRYSPEQLDEKAKDSLQLRSYALALVEMLGEPPTRVSLDYVVVGSEGGAALSAQILKNHRKKLGEIAEQIRRRQFLPNTSPKHQCIAHRYWGSGEDD